jgi:hypothetical protein
MTCFKSVFHELRLVGAALAKDAKFEDPTTGEGPRGSDGSENSGPLAELTAPEGEQSEAIIESANVPEKREYATATVTAMQSSQKEMDRQDVAAPPEVADTPEGSGSCAPRRPTQGPW